MTLDNAPNNIVLAGDVKCGHVFRYMKKFYMATQPTKGVDVKGVDLENGELLDIESTASVEVFPNVKVVF